MEENQKLEIGKIKKMIHNVDGQYVILDTDLALIYGYVNGAKEINKNVKRNLQLFNNEHCFQLLESEWNILRYQSGTSKGSGGRRYLPYVFTEEGVKILSRILRKPNVQSGTLEMLEAFKSIKHDNIRNLSMPVNKGERIENLIYNIRDKQVMMLI